LGLLGAEGLEGVVGAGELVPGVEEPASDLALVLVVVVVVEADDVLLEVAAATAALCAGSRLNGLWARPRRWTGAPLVVSATAAFGFGGAWLTVIPVTCTGFEVAVIGVEALEPPPSTA
jgi:hypothetical protein